MRDTPGKVCPAARFPALQQITQQSHSWQDTISGHGPFSKTYFWKVSFFLPVGQRLLEFVLRNVRDSLGATR
jgi:hypothetical protein